MSWKRHIVEKAVALLKQGYESKATVELERLLVLWDSPSGPEDPDLTHNSTETGDELPAVVIGVDGMSLEIDPFGHWVFSNEADSTIEDEARRLLLGSTRATMPDALRDIKSRLTDLKARGLIRRKSVPT